MTAFLLTTCVIQAAYMKYGSDTSVNWLIAYHASNFALIAACAYEQAEKEVIKRVLGGRMLMRIIALFWGYFMFAELSYINSDIKTYQNETTMDELWSQIGFLLAAASMLIVIDVAKKYLFKDARQS